MRLFVALDLNDEVREGVAKFLAQMRAALPHARWVHAETLHVTLKFIGSAPESRVAEFSAALSQVKSAEPARLDFRGTGFFPNEKRPRVFWLGAESSPNVATIAADIDRRLAKLGVDPEDHDFWPHLTLARLDDGRNLETLHAEIERIGGQEFGSVVTDQFHLYHSDTLPSGAKHTKIASFRFHEPKA